MCPYIHVGDSSSRNKKTNLKRNGIINSLKRCQNFLRQFDLVLHVDVMYMELSKARTDIDDNKITVFFAYHSEINPKQS